MSDIDALKSSISMGINRKNNYKDAYFLSESLIFSHFNANYQELNVILPPN